MSKTNSAIKSTRTLHEQLKESRVVLFGSPSDPEVAESIRRMKQLGREVTTRLRPSFDTGTGRCGKHLCHCTTHCMQEYSKDQVI